MGKLLAVFSPVAVVGLMEITGVTGCLGLELGFALSGGACVGLDCLGVYCGGGPNIHNSSVVAASGFVETTGVKCWLELGLPGGVVAS